MLKTIGWYSVCSISFVNLIFLQAKAEMVKFNNKMEGAVKSKPRSSKDGKLKRKLKRKKQKQKEVDPKAPKPPMSAYFEFLQKERRKVFSELKAASYQDKLKEIGRRWRSLSEKERAPFVSIADEKKKKFRQVSQGKKPSLFWA